MLTKIPANRFRKSANPAAYAALLACLGSLPGWCQGTLSQSNLPMQALGPNDLIAINVLGVPELTRPVRIGADGSVRLPLMSDPIPAAGKLPAEVESAIAAALRENDLVVDPVVTVTVVDYVSRSVTVAGAVRNPGIVRAMAGMRLLDAITRAGGLAEDAGSEILLTPARGDSPGRHISTRDLIERQDEQANPVLEGGEEIRVPRAPKIFIMGNVRKPGSIALVDSSASSVMKALALAEGLAPFASNEAYILRRSAGNSEREEIPVNLAKILNRKSPDVILLGDDIFYVPDNKTKRISTGVLDRLASFGSATASGVVIWRR